MSANALKLTGGKAILVLVAVVAFGIFRFVSARAELNSEGRAVLEDWIAGELIRPALRDSTTSLLEKGAAVLGGATVRIESMTARGSLDDMVVKVELVPSDLLPPGTELTRYYRMTYSTVTGWQHKGRATSLTYHLAFF